MLGILYESLIHPLTIISTLPSAGVGALMALVLFHTELNIIAMIGIILLIGIVKKNAIMMIDFALAAERNEGLNAARSDLPGLPAALPAHHDDDHVRAAGRHAAGARTGVRLGTAAAPRYCHRRRLVVSQMLTLFTTPVIYLSLTGSASASPANPIPYRPGILIPGGAHTAD